LRHSSFLVFILLFLLVLQACSPTRHLRDDQYLLRRNVVLNNNTHVSNSEMMNFVRQKPNRKILGIFRFHLQTYNLVNVSKEEKRQEERIKKRAEKNRIREEKGKKPRREEPRSFNQWLLSIGEKPVLADSNLVERSSAQIELLLKTKGYFDATVTDSFTVNKRRKMITAFFTISASTPYRITEIDVECNDPVIYNLVRSDAKNSLLKDSMIFENEVMDNERNRITEFLRNEGYFNFNRSFISYTADTGVGNRQVALTLTINEILKKVSGYADSTIDVHHKRYVINDIFVVADHQPQTRHHSELDTLLFNQFNFVSSGLLQIKPKILKSNFFINKGELYNKSRVEYTYSRLSELRAFKFINIQFKEVDENNNLLDCYVLLTPAAKQSVTMEIQGTNTSGNLGIAGGLNYGNKNLFKGIENFEIRLNAALEAQPILNPSEENTTIRPYLPFNTIQLGPTMTLTIPKFLGPFKIDDKRNIKTKFTTGFNYQLRPDYNRSIFNVTYGYTWKRRQETHILNPVELNYLNVRLSPAFSDLLESLNNLFFINAFKPQFISAMRYSYIYSNQDASKIANYRYFRINLETAGMLLNLSRNFYSNPEQVDEQFTVFNVPYSQYFRIDTDFRYFKALPRFQSFVIRNVLGIGLPYGNSTVMPFEKSFFGGGANGNRAWFIRSLGPGGFQKPDGVRFDQIGDLKIETSMEYRAKIYKFLETALFTDIGNIWLTKVDEQRPDANFDITRFYKEFGIGAGLGFRFNFNFFILRLDAAHPIHDPSFAEGARWQFNNLKMKRVNFNFAIGYPF
jgi:outer membrane protein assembly factor BamA